jgi:hypothetical protein
MKLSHSLAEINCTQCEITFTGVLNAVFNIEETYAATCPSCNEEVFFNPGIGILDTSIPDNAVLVKHVANLNGY